MLSSIDEAISELKSGKLIIVVDDEDRENEGDLVGVAENITGEQVNFMIREGRGLVCVPLSESVVKHLDLNMQEKKYAKDIDCNFTESVDFIEVYTGISALERAKTIKALVSRNSRPEDFRRPGHVFPLEAKAGGVLERNGHTEAAVELASLAGFSPAGVICEIINDDGTMARMPNLIEFAKRFELKIISIKSLIEYLV